MTDTPLHPGRLKTVRHTAATRAEITKQASKEVTRIEAELRDAKTLRLRQARLEMETRQAEARASGETTDVISKEPSA